MTQDKHAYVPGLDGIRAICITVVVLGHLGFGDLVPGGLGVTAFFFLSGYLITGLLSSEHERFGRVDLARFYGRRMLRLLPELAVFIGVLGLVVAPIAHQPLPLTAAVAALTYWTNYYMVLGFDTCTNCSPVGHLWSLAVEEHFYLVMPLAMAACAFAPKRLRALLATVLVACLAWRLYAHIGLKAPEIYTYKTTECRMDSIGWGCLAAVIQRSQPKVMHFVRQYGEGLFAMGVALIMATLLIREINFRETLRYSLQGVALTAIILPMVNDTRLAWVSRVLEWAPLRWMGRRSYGAYLWHYVALTVTAAILGVHGQMERAVLHDRLAGIPIVLAATWILAALSYTLVFRPSQKLKPLLMPRAKPAREAAAVSGELAV